jgi:hypothetical protein
MKKSITRDPALGNIRIGIYVLAATVLLPAMFSFAQTNDLFDNSPTVALKNAETITVSGEVEKEMVVPLSSLPLRSVAVKETVLDGGKPVFRGAYRYDGYSLADILNRVIVKKKNAAEYRRMIDLYVEVSNEAGDRALFSWGEIFYPADTHRILVAAAVSRFVPQLTKEIWPLPAESKLVAETDFSTIRGIRSPTRVTIKSLDFDSASLGRTASLAPKTAVKIHLKLNGITLAEFDRLPENIPTLTYPATLYGQGKGFLGIREMTGVTLSAFLSGKFPPSDAALREGLVAIIAADGYRAVFSLSELCNRNDRQEFLLMGGGEADGAPGFSIFPTADFFFDRAVGGIAILDILIPDIRGDGVSASREIDLLFLSFEAGGKNDLLPPNIRGEPLPVMPIGRKPFLGPRDGVS